MSKVPHSGSNLFDSLLENKLKLCYVILNPMPICLTNQQNSRQLNLHHRLNNQYNQRTQYNPSLPYLL